MVTTSSINLSGSFQSKSEGFIASLANSKSMNKVTDGIVNGAGDEAEKWFNKQLANDKFKKVTVPILTEGVKQIVNLGLNSLVGSFLGIFSPAKPNNKNYKYYTRIC